MADCVIDVVDLFDLLVYVWTDYVIDAGDVLVDIADFFILSLT